MITSTPATTPDPVPAADDVTRFVAALYPTDEGLIEARALPHKARTFVPVGDVAGVAAFLETHADQNCYTGVATRRSRDGGALAHCAELWTVFVDVDFKTTPEADARAAVAVFPIAPHVVIHSGGGLHCYWRLKEPIALPGEAATAYALLRRLAIHFGGDMSSAEPVRILRVPTSRNFKYDPPRPVVLEYCDVDAAINPCDLDERLPSEPAPTTKPNGSDGAPFQAPDRIHDGQRNSLLYRSARSLHAKNWSTAAISAALAAENTAKCDPPLPADEVEAIAAHAATQADRADFVNDDAPADDRPFEITALDLIARAREAPPVRMLIEGLVPGEGTVVPHGQPRCLKTWLALECGLALSTGTPALGALPVSAAVPVLYLTNEDAWHVVGRRLEALLRGRGLADIPEPFGFAIHAGVWLDDPAWQARLIARIKSMGYRVVILDPLRSLTGCVDQGPRELQPFARYLRRLIDETGAVPLLSHHDTKPVAGQRDVRSRPQRASGGALFSIADSPIHCERLNDDDPVSLVVPSLWKLCETPPALRVALTWDADGARLTATPIAGSDVRTAALDESLLAAVREAPDRSTRALAAAVHADRSSVAARLERLADAGQLDSRHGARNAVLWFPRSPDHG